MALNLYSCVNSYNIGSNGSLRDLRFEEENIFHCTQFRFCFNVPCMFTNYNSSPKSFELKLKYYNLFQRRFANNFFVVDKITVSIMLITVARISHEHILH